MSKKLFEFDLYRINLVQAPLMLFEELNKPVKSDKDVLEILSHSVLPQFRVTKSGSKNAFEWAVREYVNYSHDDEERRGRVYGMTLAKSVTETMGEIVTDTSIEEGVSAAEPPIADTCRLFFYLKRHLAVIERRSSIMNSGWRVALEEILREAAKDLHYSGWIELEPVPRHEEILEAFRSFERLTRLRVTLRRPNPELSRYSEGLYQEMEAGAIREYLQDMKNPSGLSKDEGRLPHATAEIAAAGYKKGEVTLEGLRKRKREVVKTGGTAARGHVTALRDYVRGMKDNARAKEARQITAAILDEIDRIAPQPKEGGEQK